MKLLFWVFFQAPDKYNEMVDYCVLQIESEKSIEDVDVIIN